MIRVRRYEIIKLGLDGGEGDGMAREYDRRVGRVPGAFGMLEAMGRWMAWRRGRGEEGRGGGRGITVFRIPVYERQPRRARARDSRLELLPLPPSLRKRLGRSGSKRTRRSARGAAAARGPKRMSPRDERRP